MIVVISRISVLKFLVIHIFTVFRAGRRVATTAVHRKYPRGWGDPETHGRQNSRVEPGLLEAADTLGEAYQRAWLEDGNHKAHMTWTAPIEGNSLDPQKDGSSVLEWVKAA